MKPFYSRFEFDTEKADIKYVLVLGIWKETLSNAEKADILGKQIKILETELNEKATPSYIFLREISKMGGFVINEWYLDYSGEKTKILPYSIRLPFLKKDRFGINSINNYNIGNYAIEPERDIEMIVAKEA